MKSFIFLTFEGTTFQPNSEAVEPDIDNLQVIGVANGKTESVALYNLIKENPGLLKSEFDEVFTYQLVDDYARGRKQFSLKMSGVQDCLGCYTKLKEKEYLLCSKCEKEFCVNNDVPQKGE